MSGMIQRANSFVYRCANDANYTMTLMRGAVRELTGCAPEEFLDPPQKSFAAIYHPEEIDWVVAEVEKALQKRESWHLTFRMMQPNGTFRWCHEVGAGVFDANGKLMFLEGLIMDYEAKKRQETEASSRNNQIALFCRDLVSETKPILSVLRELRILAINARIEAARAGHAGAGFSVVAGEVGRIANETATRATKVSELTEDLQQLLRQG